MGRLLLRLKVQPSTLRRANARAPMKIGANPEPAIQRGNDPQPPRPGAFGVCAMNERTASRPARSWRGYGCAGLIAPSERWVD